MDIMQSKSEEQRERHVCFKSSVAETNVSSLAMKARQSGELSGLTSNGFSETGSSPAGSSLNLSSTAPLNSDAAGSPGLSEFFPEEPAVPPNPFLDRRRGHGGFRAYPDLVPLVTSVTTSVEDYAQPDRDGNGDVGGALSWLRNFLIGVLVAALLVAVASAGGVMNWTGSAAADQRSSRTPSSSEEMEFVEERLMVAAPHVPAGPAPTASSGKQGGSGNRRNTTSTGIPNPSIAASAGTDNFPTVVPIAGVVHGREATPPSNYESLRNMWRRECGHYFYTYCDSIRQEWYHKPSAHGCVATTTDSVHVCNRGANRFANLEACFASCVHGDRKPDRCFESSLFTRCDRTDVVATWWFFDGHRCQRWNFPLGSCPSKKSQVFRSLHRCLLECLPQGDGQPRNTTTGITGVRRCEVPVAATCSARQLRYPYFADMRAEGSGRCVKASVANLLTRRCLVGSNRFASHATCSRFCDQRELGS